ncbi:MAG: choice-of-anchor V domain-containing protein [Pyrinomonadaceae bacterium]
MSFNIGKTTLIKLASVIVFLLIAITGFLPGDRQEVDASAFGPSASFTNAPNEGNCTACHTTNPVNTGGGSVTISGLPLNYLPGQQIPITVRTARDSMTAYGFQMTAIDQAGRTVGQFTLPMQNPARTQTIAGLVNNQTRIYVQHTVDGLFTNGVFGSNSWTFQWTAPAQRVGKIDFYAAGNAADGNGAPSQDFIYTTSGATLSGSATSNFDADFQSDIAVFRPSNGVWYSIRLSDGNVRSVSWGLAGDKIVPGDYDGDGITDYAVFRPSNGVWYIWRSSDQGFAFVQFGINTDIPAQGDYDGDGKTDVAVYRPSTGVWYLLRSTAGLAITQWGISEDKPAQGDYDGDAKTDLAVFRPSTGIWYILRSTTGFSAVNWGVGTDRLAHADHDGDGMTDIAVFRPSNGGWYVLRSSGGFTITQFGSNGDVASPADFDADGKADHAVFRPSTGVWYFVRSSDGSVGILQFGSNGDISIPSGYLGDAQ